ncbi:hypothetical protein J4438_02735 [Candidatus Woesearchaeota archaeon]|nr:hypothetical protein [Candidatus Woesearchaeota archaeon]
MVWRNKVNNNIKEHLELRINQTIKEKEAIQISSNPGKSQLWCAIANLSKELEESKRRLKELENFVTEKLSSKKNKKELNKIVRTLRKL